MNTIVYKIDDAAACGEQLRNAADVLRKGGLVVFPTETVYGIAARGDIEGMNALTAIKGRDDSKFYSLHIPDDESVGKYVPYIDMRAKKLIKNFWPGPVTIVFKLTDEQLKAQQEKLGKKWACLYKDNSIGVRCPDNHIASRLLELAGVPVVATSANISGMPAATCFDDAFECFDGKLPVIIDGGDCEESLASTVVRISSGSIDVLREGAVSSEEISDISTVNILFVCGSNTCCSPIAAQICRKLLAGKVGCDVERLELFGYKVRSAGVMVPVKQPENMGVVELCGELGFDLSGHKIAGLMPRDILCSDLILVMEAEQRNRIVDFYPELADKCKLLAGDYDICDPADGGLDVYANFATLVENAITERIGELLI